MQWSSNATQQDGTVQTYHNRKGSVEEYYYLCHCGTTYGCRPPGTGHGVCPVHDEGRGVDHKLEASCVEVAHVLDLVVAIAPEL